MYTKSKIPSVMIATADLVMAPYWQCHLMQLRMLDVRAHAGLMAQYQVFRSVKAGILRRGRTFGEQFGK
jgi:hypothetical protein